MVTILARQPSASGTWEAGHLVLAASDGRKDMTSMSLSMRRRTKQEVCENFIENLRERGDIDVQSPNFIDSIRQHFEKLPTRYAVDVNIESLDVLSHKRLLEEARADPSTVAFAVRPVEVLLARRRDDLPLITQPSPRVHSKRYVLPRPAFGSSPNLQALALEAGERADVVEGLEPTHDADLMNFYEITIASVDQPKLLSKLSEALGDLNLNIREAHAFNTADGFALDVFIVNGWGHEENANIEEMLGQRLLQMPSTGAGSWQHSPSLRIPEELTPTLQASDSWRRPGSPLDDWEIDIAHLHIDAKIAAGSFSNLYKGYYCGQEVAVKILKDLQDDNAQYQEFLQEVSIMRKVRHKNVVQFIGACTRKPNLCIVFEYMSGGSVYDFIRREGPFKISQVLKIAVEVARGMDYLHQRRIIHRDLKAANILMDDNHNVKIADFGVARIIEASGHMTAETGTYRWMAPEVIEHKPYDEKADVFSFAVVLWELLTCKVPYSDMTPLQAAVGVVQKGLRPPIPPQSPPALNQIMEACWDSSPAHRPTFKELTPRLQQLFEMAKEEEARKPQPKPGGLLSKLRGKGP